MALQINSKYPISLSKWKKSMYICIRSYGYKYRVWLLRKEHITNITLQDVFLSFPWSPTASLSEPGGVPVFMPSSGQWKSYSEGVPNGRHCLQILLLKLKKTVTVNGWLCTFFNELSPVSTNN